MMEGILGQIANPQMANIPAALDARQKRIDDQNKALARVAMGREIAKALPGLQEGSGFKTLAENDPQMFAVTAKALGIPLNDSERFNQFSNDVSQLYTLASADPNQAYAHAQQLIAQRKEQGQDTTQLDKWVQAMNEDPMKAVTSLFVMHRSINPQQEGMTPFQQAKIDLEREKMERGAGEQNYKGEVFNAAGGSYVFDGKSNKMVPLLDEKGNQVVAANYDPTLQGGIVKSKTEQKQSLDQVEKYFQKLEPINSAINNYDEGIAAIDSGAEVGKIQNLLPSFRASTIELQNITRRLGLDVISNTTFGALSEAELKMALETAAPPLNSPDLKDWMIRKKDAQIKLRDYVENAISYLGEGNTIADLAKLNKKTRETSKPAVNDRAQETGSTKQQSLEDLLSKY
jgi:hypothetical protein